MWNFLSNHPWWGMAYLVVMALTVLGLSHDLTLNVKYWRKY